MKDRSLSSHLLIHDEKGSMRTQSLTLYPPTQYGVDFSKPGLRTMPLCKFPEMAHYSGQGDVKSAVNWSCPANDKSMLKLGESGLQAGVVK